MWYRAVNLCHFTDPFFTGGTQMRYWGICSNESLVTSRSTVHDGCAYDEQIPVDDEGHYTVVCSTPEDRPSNAIERCSVKWLDWGAGDGVPQPNTRPTAAMIIVRNLLSDPSFEPSFEQAAQRVPPPGFPAQVAATMGPYMPTLAYLSPAQFEALGCKAN